MDPDKLPTFDSSEEDDGRPKPSLRRSEATETIELSGLFPAEAAGEVVDLQAVRKTSFAKLMDALPIPACLIDRSAGILFANDAWSRLGSNKERLQGVRLHSLFFSKEAARAAQTLFEKILFSRKPQTCEGLISLDGRKIWARMHSRALRIGVNRTVLALFENLTSEKRQLILNKRHEEQIKLAYSDLERLVRNRTAELSKANDQLRREIVLRKKTEDALTSAREDLEARVKARTRELTAINAKLVSEIRERRRIESALRESEDQYRAVVENADQAIFVSKGGEIQFANPKTTEILGYSREELTSIRFQDLVHPEDRASALETLRQDRPERVPGRVYSFRVVDKAGNIKWLEVNTASIGWKGSPATLAFASDVTSRKRVDEELMKIEKLESLGFLAGGIAHDFNNVLTAILGSISVAKIHLRSMAKVMEKLTEGERGCLNAQGLTQQLLTFSKGGTPVKQVTDISEIAKRTTSFALTGSNVRCESHFASDLGTVEVDESQMGQVFQNIAINAQQAMPQGGIINISGENFAVTPEDGLPLPNGPYVRISVRDHGPGIPTEHIAKIFDPYFSTKQKGSGLGLATAYSIMNKHDGLIKVESEPGKGSVFHLYLPMSGKGKTAEPKIQQGDPIVPGKGRILVMDDDESIRGLAGELLFLIGYEVVLAEEGGAAIEMYREAKEANRPFDAVVMDLTVRGGIGGKDAIQALRQIDPDVRAIVSSGYSTDPVMANYEMYGFKDVVTKPYTVQELSSALHRVMLKKVAPENVEGAKQRDRSTSLNAHISVSPAEAERDGQGSKRINRD